MNDLYLTTYNPTSIDIEQDGIECNSCKEELDADCVVVVETSDGCGEANCTRCAEKAAAAFPGTVHDQREDPEALLRDILRWLSAPYQVHTSLERDFIARIVKR